MAVAVVGSQGEESEALAALVQIAGRKTHPIPAQLLARHVLSLPGDWDWPVRRAAFEAVLRRLASARSQELSVVEGPRLGQGGQSARDDGGRNPRNRTDDRWSLKRPDGDGFVPYDVRLLSLDPLVGRCDCPDFTRSTLGLCKHLLTVVDALCSKRVRPLKGLQSPSQPLPADRSRHLAGWRLAWDATPSTFHSWDILEGVRLIPPSVAGKQKVRTSPLQEVFVAPERGEELTRPRALRAVPKGDPQARLRLVNVLDAQRRRDGGAAADPSLRAVLEEERQRLGRVIELRKKAASLDRALRRLKRRLYSYQKEGVRRFLEVGRLVLADDMGLGKTTQATAAVSALFDSKLVERALIVVPASLKPQWQREWDEVSRLPIRMVEGAQDERLAMYRTTRKGILLTNYEQVMRDFEAISAWRPQLMVLDEAQRIKNWATKTASTMKRLRPTFRLVLTGTPMENRLEELASIVEWVDDRVLEPKWRLVPFHSVVADGNREVVGARNLAALRARLAPVLLRRVRTEVLAQLPARQDTVVPVDLTTQQREAHDELNQPVAKLAAMARRRPLTPPEFLRLMSLLATQRVISNGLAQLNFQELWPDIKGRRPTPKLVESLDAPKLAELRELIANLVITQRRKVVVFSQWRRMLELASWVVGDLLAAAGMRALFFTGQEKDRRRTQNLVDFHDDPQATVLFLTDAGGVGLNLQRAASACINLELPWNPAVIEQRIGRIHRLGQKRPVDIYNLMSRGCIEERIAGLVTDKKALFKGIFMGDTDELRFERSGALLSVLEALAPAGEKAATDHSGDRDGDEQGEDVAASTAIEDAVASEKVEVSAIPSPGGGQPVPAIEAGAAHPVGDTPGADIVELLGQLQVERTSDGGVRIAAPPQAAAALVSLFSGIARLIGATNISGAPGADATTRKASTENRYTDEARPEEGPSTRRRP